MKYREYRGLRRHININYRFLNNKIKRFHKLVLKIKRKNIFDNVLQFSE